MSDKQIALEELPMTMFLPQELKKLVVDCFVPASFRFGGDIVTEGEDPDAVYVLAEGRARMVKHAANGEEIALNVLKPGETFGATGLLDPGAIGKRTTTVRASSDVKAYKLDPALFRTLLANNPEIKNYIELEQRHRRLSNFIKLYTSLAKLPAEALKLLTLESETVEVKPGEVVIRQGEAIGPMCIVEEGRLRVWEQQGTRQRERAFLRKGDMFGELAIARNQPRQASVEALTECRLITINEKTFGKLYARFPEFRNKIEERIAGYEYKKTARLPLDFAQEILPANADPAEQVSPGQLDQRRTAAQLGPFATEDGHFVKGRKRILRFPHIRQIDEMDCGAASLAMTCAYFGRKVSLTRIRQIVHTATDGTSLRGLCQGAEALGLAARSVKASKSNVGQMPLPAVIHWENYHWVVLFDVSDKHAWIADPATGNRKITRKELNEKWNGYAALFDYTEAFERAPETKTGFGWLMPFLRPFASVFAKAFGLAVIVSALQMLLPVFTQVIVDSVLVENDTSLLAMMIGSMLVVLVFMTVAMLVQRYLLSFVAVRVDSSSLDFITRRLLALPISYFAARKTGDIQRRILGVRQVREFLVQNGVNGLTAVAQISAAIALMLLYSPKLAVVFLAVAPLYAGLMKYSSKRLGPMFDELEESYGKYSSHQIDAIKGIETVKALGAESPLREKMLAEFHSLADKQFKSNFILMSYEGMVQTVGFLSMALFLFVGAQQVMSNEMTIGAMVAFNSLVAMANAPILTLLSMWDNWQFAAVLLNRVNDIFESEPEQGFDHSHLKPVRTLEGSVRLQDVSFQYGGPESPKILDGISIDIPAGKIVAIVGRSGSGKTTLVKCLAGILEPTEGTIYFDGVEQKKLRYRDLRRQIGFVLQENYLFDDTIAKNMGFGDEDPDLERVAWAATVANAHDFIQRLPLGYDTRVGETGIALSGGQRQRIAIARALYNKPPILIFDEATSALDTESEKAVKENMDQLLKGRTSFVIAHRLSTIRDADLILVIEKGKIIEKGAHEDLMERQGLYYYLNSQQLAL
ncbi:MAG TPA: peptidase domain-containing ABC transporter [Blastocatellia bacterium]|nr:peptidase domain-containing ABC transporter [Blastocatellia bacterium]